MDIIATLNILLGLSSPLVWLVRNEIAFRLIGAALPLAWAGLNYAQGLMDSALILAVISARALVGLLLMNKGMTIKGIFAAVFIGFFTVMLFKGYKDIYSILPWFAACLTTLAQLYLTGVRLRMTQCIGADGAWIVYDVVNKVWWHLFEKSVGVVLNLWTVRGMLKASRLAIQKPA